MAFGLLHGFGFASALGNVGLPQSHVSPALLSFNLGVEAGQLCIVGLAAAVWQSLRSLPRLRKRLRAAVVLGLGAAACYWSLERGASMLELWDEAQRSAELSKLGSGR